MYPAMASIEAPRVPPHRDQATFALHARDFSHPGQTVGQRYFDLHVLAGSQARHRLFPVQRRWGAEDDCVDITAHQAILEAAVDARNSESIRDLAGRSRIPADKRDHPGSGYPGKPFQVFDAEGTSTRQGEPDRFAGQTSSGQ